MAERDELDEFREDVDEERVESRASGRPPEEADSDDPEGQARAILEESEERVAAGEAAADA